MKKRNSFIGCLAMVLLLGGGVALAETFYWVPDGNTWGSFSDPSNWLIGGADGTNPENSIPGGNDTLADQRHMRFDLGGETYSVGAWKTTADWNPWNLSMTNGCLQFNGEVSLHSGQIHIYDETELKFTSSSSLTLGNNDAGCRYVTIHDGGKLTIEMAYFNMYNGTFTVEEGGIAEFKNTSFRSTGSQGDQSGENQFINRGTLSFYNDLILNNSDWGPNIEFIQESGVLTLGGFIRNQASKASFDATFSGGIIKAVAPIGFENVTAVIPENANLTFNLVESVDLGLDIFTEIAETAKFTACGDGYILVTIDRFPQIRLDGGGVALVSQGATYDLSNVLAEGSTLGRIRIDSLVTLTGTIPENLTFSVKLDAVAPGVPFVTCENTAVLEKIKSDIEKSLPHDTIIEINGSSLSTKVQSTSVFNQTTITDLSNKDGWMCGEVPTDKDVYIQGEGVKAIITGEIPSFKSITVMDGAELIVNMGEGNICVLPPIAMIYKSSFTIQSGNVTLENGFTATAVEETVIPQVTISAGAKLSVNDSAHLSNINLMLSGTLEHLNSGNLVLGSAPAGQTGYFGLTAEGATFVLNGTGSKILQIACPIEGGRVIVPNAMTVKNSSFSCPTEKRYFGIHLGVNNPIDSPIALNFENTSIATSSEDPSLGSSLQIEEECKVGGAAVLTLGTGCKWQTHWGNSGSTKGGFTLENRGQLVITDGAFLKHHHNKDPNTLNPDEDGFPSVVVSNGGILQTGRCDGNGKGVYKIENGIIRVVYRFGFETYRDTILFKGAKAIEVPEGATATICGVVNRWREHDKYLTNSVPFVGGGNVIITNAHPEKAFCFYQNSPNSTLTGSLTVADVDKTKFIFLDGANWAGTVHSRNVELDHVGTSTSTNAFDALHLDGDFQMAVTADGVSDFLAMGAGGFSGDGRLVFPADADYDAFGKLVFGSALAAEMPLPRVKAPGRKATLEECKDGTFDMVLKGDGFKLIVR